MNEHVDEAACMVEHALFEGEACARQRKIRKLQRKHKGKKLKKQKKKRRTH